MRNLYKIGFAIATLICLFMAIQLYSLEFYIGFVGILLAAISYMCLFILEFKIKM